MVPTPRSIVDAMRFWDLAEFGALFSLQTYGSGLRTLQFSVPHIYAVYSAFGKHSNYSAQRIQLESIWRTL